MAPVQGRVLEEDVFDEPLVDARVDDVARINDVVEAQTALYDDESTHLTARHVHTGQHYGHDCLLVDNVLLGFAVYKKEACHRLEPLMCAKRIEKAAYFLLEEHDKTDDSHAHELVHDGSEQTHLKHLTHEKPHQDEDDDAYKDIERTAFLHQAVDVVEHEGDKKNVDDVLYSEFKHNESDVLVLIIVTQSRQVMKSACTSVTPSAPRCGLPRRPPSHRVRAESTPLS